MPDIVEDGHNGLLIPPDNPAALTDALRLLCEDAVLRARLAARALETAQQFAWPRVLDCFEKVVTALFLSVIHNDED